MAELKLYNIPEEIAAFERELLDAEGEVTPELEARWKAFISAGRDKIEGAAMVVRTLEAQAKACEEEAKRIKERATSHQRNADYLKSLMVYAVDCLGGKIKTSLFTIWAQNSASHTSIDIKPGTDLEIVETATPEFVRIKREMNKERILEALEAGAEIPDCFIVEQKPGTRYLRIK